MKLKQLSKKAKLAALKELKAIFDATTIKAVKLNKKYSFDFSRDGELMIG